MGGVTVSHVNCACDQRIRGSRISRSGTGNRGAEEGGQPSVSPERSVDPGDKPVFARGSPRQPGLRRRRPVGQYRARGWKCRSSPRVRVPSTKARKRGSFVTGTFRRFARLMRAPPSESVVVAGADRTRREKLLKAVLPSRSFRRRLPAVSGAPGFVQTSAMFGDRDGVGDRGR